MKAKQYLLIIMCLCYPLLGKAQGDRKNIEIIANQDSKEVKLLVCELQLSATQILPEKNVEILIEIENNFNYNIFLFGRESDERYFKKHIRFGKSFFNRNITLCDGIENKDIMRIEPQGKRILRYKGQTDVNTICELPFYIATHKKKKFLSSEKFLIKEYFPVSLNITVKGQDLEPENDVFDKLQQEYEELVEELSTHTFCPNRKHTPSLSEQEEVYQARINDMENEINSIKEKNNWTYSSTKFKKYEELLNKLKEIHFRERDCGGHNNPQTHSCNYDSWTPKQVLEKLETLYKKLDNGVVRKDAAIEQAKAIKSKYTGGCPILKSKMGKDNAIKNKVDIYYDRIIKY